MSERELLYPSMSHLVFFLSRTGNERDTTRVLLPRRSSFKLCTVDSIANLIYYETQDRGMRYVERWFGKLHSPEQALVL